MPSSNARRVEQDTQPRRQSDFRRDRSRRNTINAKHRRQEVEAKKVNDAAIAKPPKLRAMQFRFPIQYIVSLAIIFACALLMVFSVAQNSGIETQIRLANRDTHRYQDTNNAMRTQLGGRYTLEEIEYIAFHYLGMSHPDPSQIIEINVPRQSHVVLNTAGNTQQQNNSFFRDIREFLGSVANTIFGGSQ